MSWTDLASRLEVLEREFHDVQARLGDPDVAADQSRYIELSKRYKELDDVVTLLNRLRETEGDLEAARELHASADPADRELLRGEVNELEAAVEQLGGDLRMLLLPSDPFDERNVIIEIRGAEGGEEANLFAKDLFGMYQGFASSLGWKMEVMSSSPSDLGGLAEVTFRLSGDRVWSRMKFEAGVHRVQRVPVTESQGRIHTSSATVAVLPEADEVDVQIDPNDLNVDVYRSSGPGGQSVNTTDSAVRITHLPTGLVVAMQDEKSQIQNRAKALQVLRARLLKLEQDRQMNEASGQRKAQIGGGGRSEKVRTYNFKENRVSDHRIGLTLYHLDKILSGDLTEISDALVADDRATRLAEEVS
ncbi:MAG: peptide chain release factor 1 [Microthrixaceae bacterium]